MTMAQRSAAEVRNLLIDHGGAGPEFAVVQCIAAACDNTARIDDSKAKSNAELEKAFNRIGWSIKPTLCPEHNA